MEEPTNFFCGLFLWLLGFAFSRLGRTETSRTLNSAETPGPHCGGMRERPEPGAHCDVGRGGVHGSALGRRVPSEFGRRSFFAWRHGSRKGLDDGELLGTRCVGFLRQTFQVSRALGGEE